MDVMAITEEEYNNLSPEEQVRVREQILIEHKKNQLKEEERERFLKMNLVVRAEQGKKYEPTEQARHMVKKMTAFGIPMKNIADVIGVGMKSLQKYFQKELESGHTEANFMIANKLFHSAMHGDTTAAIFWCKTRLGWKETSKHIHAIDPRGSGKEDLPDINKLSEEDLATLYTILRKAKKELPAP